MKLDGHAIEARIYAENPARGFLPSTGTLKHLRMPEGVEFTIGAVPAPALRCASIAACAKATRSRRSTIR